jgi:hypothetical protein
MAGGLRGGQLHEVGLANCQPLRGLLDLTAVVHAWPYRVKLEPLPAPFDIILGADGQADRRFTLAQALELNAKLGSIAASLPAWGESSQAIKTATLVRDNVGLIEAALGECEQWLMADRDEEAAAVARAAVDKINSGIGELQKAIKQINTRRQVLLKLGAKLTAGFKFARDKASAGAQVDAEGTTASRQTYADACSILCSTALTPQQVRSCRSHISPSRTPAADPRPRSWSPHKELDHVRRWHLQRLLHSGRDVGTCARPRCRPRHSGERVRA